MTNSICEIEACNQLLDEDISIHIWGKSDSNSENGYTDEMTICDCCHQELEDDLHEEGWKHDEDEDCDWF